MNTVGKIIFPWGDADHLTPEFAASMNVGVSNNLSIIEPGTLTGNATLNIDISPEMHNGAMIIVKQKTNGTETLSFGTGIAAPDMVGAAGRTRTQLFVLVDGEFIAAGASVQID